MEHRKLAVEAGDCLTELEADRALIQETIQKLTSEETDGKKIRFFSFQIMEQFKVFLVISTDVLLRQKYAREMELMFLPEEEEVITTPRRPGSNNSSRRPSLSSSNHSSTASSPAKSGKKLALPRMSPKGNNKNPHPFEGF